jgi:two-component system, response regulator PdtaR
MLSGERLLIIEDVFLIALGMQYALEGANVQQTVFARNFEEAAALADRFGEFDLAIVNPPRPGTADVKTAELLVAAGPAIVVCTAARIDLGGGPLAGAEMIIKPYIDEDLLAACRRALAKRQLA